MAQVYLAFGSLSGGTMKKRMRVTDYFREAQKNDLEKKIKKICSILCRVEHNVEYTDSLILLSPEIMFHSQSHSLS